MGRRLILAWLGLLLSGCPSEPPPNSVRLELPEVVVNRDAVRPTVRARRGNTTNPVAPGRYALRAGPPAVAAANPDGTLACLKSGDAKVTVDVTGVASTSTLRCRLVDRLEVSELPLIELDNGPVTLAVRVLAKDGSELSDVPISVASTNQAPVRVKGPEITPVAVGTTDLVVRAGGAEQKFGTRVVRSLLVTPKPLYGGKRVDIDLPRGKYEILVELAEPKELRIDWRGVRECAYRTTGKTHRSTCTLAEKASVVVDNPVFVESGETSIVKERFRVREVP
jgi:hypothetical protein